MRRTRFVNATPGLTVATSINATHTTLDVSGASALPSEGDFNIAVGSEIMLVTHRTGNDLTVVRGVDNTTANSYTIGQDVIVIATKTGMDKIVRDSRGSVGAIDGLPKRLTVTSGDFSWTNQGTSNLIQDTWGGITMVTQCSGGSGHNIRVAYITSPSEPWTLTIHMLPSSTAENGTVASHCGLVLSESGSTRLETLSIRLDSTLAWWGWTSPTNYSSQWALDDVQMCPDGQWIRMVNDGTDLIPYRSADGVNWYKMNAGHAKGYFLTSNGPERIGFYQSSSQKDGEMCHLQSWLVS